MAALAAGVAVSWVTLVLLARQMGGMEAMPAPASMELRPWALRDFLMMLVMWVVMMVGMMIPAALPTILVYAAVARKAARAGTPVAPTASFVAGYVGVWSFFSLLATLAQWGLDRAALLSPMLVVSAPWLGALTLLAAGIWQLTPAKEACLRHCRAPAEFMARHWRPGVAGALRLGVFHGAFCLACCWALMGLLFVGGVMNLVWIAAITLFVLAEKLLPRGQHTARWSGVGMILAAGLVAGGWLAAPGTAP